MPFNSDVCFSHSNKNKLSEHLFYVGKALYYLLPYNKDIGFLLGIFHDFGKITSYYQKYIQSIIFHEPLLDVPDRLKAHTLLGVLLNIFFFSDYLGDKNKNLLLPILNSAFHHSVLSDIEKILIMNNNPGDDIINRQVQDLNKRISIIENVYKTEIVELIENDSDLSLKQFVNLIKNIDFLRFINILLKPQKILKTAYQVYQNEIKSKSGSIELAFFTTAIYGTLINADRELADKLPDAFFKTYINQTKFAVIPSNIIERYVFDKFGERDKFKTLVFKTVNNQLNNKEAMKFSIFNITAPTGSGKTETALNFAFKLKDKMGADRIIYSLPLTNIIEQNYKRLDEIFSEYMPDYKDEKRLMYLLKYHYLANYDNLVTENNSLGEALKNAEKLNSKVIVTTYIQVLYGIFSNSPHFLSRLPLFDNSIILLDEPQVLNPSHWLLINVGLKLLTAKYNCKVIFLTATKPLIFSNTECFELTDSIDFSKYITNRTELLPSFSINSFKSLIDIIVDKSKEYNSILIVLNTIKSSIDFFKLLKDELQLTEYRIFYLSTNLIPIHRQGVIDTVNEYLATNRKAILVSTQVIEAGVEFDFDMGIRDLATFDSLVQTAGRINRKGLKKQAPLYITKLINEKTGKSFASYIYDDSFLQFTENLLKSADKIDELQYKNLTEEYFIKIASFMSDFNTTGNKENVLYYYSMLQFKTLVEKFKIIEDDFYKIPILILYDNKILDHLNDYKKVLLEFINETNYEKKWELKRLVDYAQRKIIPYIVNISSRSSTLKELKYYFVDEIKSPLSWAKVVHKDFLDKCYFFDNENKVGQGIDVPTEGGILWF